MLFVFSVSDPAAASASSSSASRVELVVKKKIGKKAIQQLDVMYIRAAGAAAAAAAAAGKEVKATAPARAVLVALVDSKLVCLDINTLSVVLEIAKDSSFSLFCIDAGPTSLQPRVCAQVKGRKKLMVYACSVHTGRAEVVRELTVPDTVIVMAQQGDTLALGYKREYSLMSLSNDNVTDVPVPVEGISPLLARCAPGELLLATTNSMGFFVNFEGEPMPRAPLLWQQTPVSVVTCGGYILALLQDNGGSVAIASLMDQKQVQTVRLSKGASSAAAVAGASVFMATYPNSDMVFVCSSSPTSTDVITFYLTSLEDQIQQYMELGLANEAAALLQRTHPTPQQLADFHLQAGFVLLRELDWVQAFEQYFPSAPGLDPREILALFPDLTLAPMPYSPGMWAQRLGTMTDLIDKGRRASKLQNEKDKSQRVKELDKFTTQQLNKQARFHLAQFLWNWRQTRNKKLAAGAAKKLNAGGGPASPALNDDVEVGVCVDTALLFLCIEFGGEESSSATPTTPNRTASPPPSKPAATATGSPTAASPNDLTLSFSLRDLLFPSNSCLLSEAERYLFTKQHYNALALLFQSNGAVRKALEVWKNMGTGEFKVAQPTKGDDEFGSSSAAKNRSNSSASIPGVSETVALLSTLSDQPLLWEFSEWVIVGWPAEGLKIFLSTRRSAGEQLHPEKVLTFLRRTQANIKSAAVAAAAGGVDGDFTLLPSASGAGGSPPPSASLDLVESYLEYFINHEKTSEVKYHTQLALCYLKKVINLQLPNSLAQEQATAAASAAARAQAKTRSSSFTTAAPSAHARFKPGHEPGMRGPPRMKLLKFLQKSTHYDAQTVLNSLLQLQLPAGSAAANRTKPGAAPISYSGLDLTQHASNLYEEVLLLNSRLGQHRRVLQIYVFDLRDELGAAAYANYICYTQREAGRRLRELKARQASLEASKAHLGGSNDSIDDTSIGMAGDAASSRNGAAGASGGSSAVLEDELGPIVEVHGHPGDVFLSLLDIYFSPEYAKLWAERNPAAAAAVVAASAPATAGAVPPPLDPSAPQAHDAALALLNKYYQLLDPVALLKLLPPTLPLHTLSHLFSRLFPSTLHTRRHNHVVAGLHKLVHLRVQSHCFALRSLQLNLDMHVKCGWCYKSLNESVFVAHPYHAVREPLEHTYVIDFENWEPILSAEEAIDQPYLLHEMPRFVLVHYQCSAQFAANGGPEALLNGQADGTKSPQAGGAAGAGRERGSSSTLMGNISVHPRGASASVSRPPPRG